MALAAYADSGPARRDRGSVERDRVRRRAQRNRLRAARPDRDHFRNVSLGQSDTDDDFVGDQDEAGSKLGRGYRYASSRGLPSPYKKARENAPSVPSLTSRSCSTSSAACAPAARRRRARLHPRRRRPCARVARADLAGRELIGIDVDPIELPRTEARIREAGYGPASFVAHANFSSGRGASSKRRSTPSTSSSPTSASRRCRPTPRRAASTTRASARSTCGWILARRAGVSADRACRAKPNSRACSTITPTNRTPRSSRGLLKQPGLTTTHATERAVAPAWRRQAGPHQGADQGLGPADIPGAAHRRQRRIHRARCAARRLPAVWRPADARLHHLSLRRGSPREEGVSGGTPRRHLLARARGRSRSLEARRGPTVARCRQSFDGQKELTDRPLTG